MFPQITDVPLGPPNRSGCYCQKGWCTCAYCPECKKKHIRMWLTSNGTKMWCNKCGYSRKLKKK